MYTLRVINPYNLVPNNLFFDKGVKIQYGLHMAANRGS